MKVKDTLLEIQELEERNKELQARNEFLSKERTRLLTEHRDLTNELQWEKRQKTALKFRCSDLTKRNMELETEIADMKFTRKYLTSEEAGRAFARELLGKPMTSEEIAIDKVENCYVPYNGDDF